MFNANSCSGENPLTRLSRASKASSSSASQPQTLLPTTKHAPPHFGGPVAAASKGRLFQPQERALTVAPKAAAPVGHAWLNEFEQGKVDRHPAGPDDAFARLFQHHAHRVAHQASSAHPWTAQFEGAHHNAAEAVHPPDQMALLEAAFHRAHLQHAPSGPHRITEWSAQFDEARSQWAEQGKEITADDLEADFLKTWNEYETAAATSDALEETAGPPSEEQYLPLQDDWAEQFVHHGAQNELDLPYHFEPNNPFLSHPDPLSEAMAMIQSPHASLTDTALALEAALQKVDTLGLSDVDVSRAWEALGRTQQENEKEMPALAALQQSIKTNPRNDTAMLASAISYINENHDEPARAALGDWIRLCYPEILPLGHPSNSHDELTAAFVAAARLGGRQRGYGAVDPDVQVGLGVLYYASNEHQRAIDCFEAALTVRPMDHVLWNRLGATLANSGKTEAAIDAYSKALSIKPSYVRAHYNLGVGCMNIGCYKEAAEHFLGALSTHHKQQTRTDSDTHHLFGISTTLWDTLRRAFYAMDRGDLAVLAKPSGTDLGVFRADFDF